MFIKFSIYFTYAELFCFHGEWVGCIVKYIKQVVICLCMASPFKSYDIRGVYPRDIDESFAYKLGRAMVLFAKSRMIAVGRDCRESSSPLTKSLIYGMTDQGADVIDLGLISTPMAYFAAREYDVVMVTASHNPKEYNGFKITRKGVIKIGLDSGLHELEQLILDDNFPEAAKKGRVKPKDLFPEYAKAVLSVPVHPLKRLRILVDTANGMGGPIVRALLAQTSVDVEVMYEEPDGSFPNHEGNPLKEENTRELQQRIKDGKFDLGVAYDTDCDRVFFIDEQGDRIPPDYILILFADLLFNENRRAVANVNCKRIVKEKIAEMEGEIFITKVGHANISRVMKEQDCVVGGEHSGHFYFKELQYADCADAALMCVLSIMSEKGHLSKLVRDFDKYASIPEMNMEVKDKEKALDRVEQAFQGASITKLDGLSVDAGDFWFVLRKSGTESLLRLNAEALDDEALKEGVQKIRDIVTRKN